MVTADCNIMLFYVLPSAKNTVNQTEIKPDLVSQPLG